jgi:hypothetical protein
MRASPKTSRVCKLQPPGTWLQLKGDVWGLQPASSVQERWAFPPRKLFLQCLTRNPTLAVPGTQPCPPGTSCPVETDKGQPGTVSLWEVTLEKEMTLGWVCIDVQEEMEWKGEGPRGGN